MNKVIEKYEKKVDNDGQLFTADDHDGFAGHTQAPHMEEYCERCKELGGPTVQQDFFI